MGLSAAHFALRWTQLGVGLPYHRVLNHGFFLLNVSPFWQHAIKGFVILLAVVLDKMNATGRDT